MVRHGILGFMKKNENIICNNQNKYSDCLPGVLLTLLSLIALGICVFYGLGEDIWFDEVFSVRFMEHGYGEIAWLTSTDVHPPMYYWYLKLFHDIGKYFYSLSLISVVVSYEYAHYIFVKVIAKIVIYSYFFINFFNIFCTNIVQRKARVK